MGHVNGEPLRMGVFYRSLPMLAGEAKGFFADHGLQIEHQQVSSSTQQFEFVRDGGYHLVQTSPDNIVNYRLNANNPVGERIDAQAFMGMDYGMNLVLTAKPAIGSVEEVRGTRVAVDALTSGFAYVIYKILQAHGLERDSDYEVLTLGGVAARYEALLDDQCDATLLSGGFETRAAHSGYVLLDSVYDVLNPYLGVVACAKRSWLEENRDAAVAFIRASRAAHDWALDPANRDEAVALLASATGAGDEVAQMLYEVQVRPGVGIVSDGSIEVPALANVMRLRAEFDGFEEPQDIDALTAPASGLYDLSYFEEAVGSQSG
jgi:ABC-type nitrate/sulfonate/bicarbonate transport system substrate-binding protein